MKPDRTQISGRNGTFSVTYTIAIFLLSLFSSEAHPAAPCFLDIETQTRVGYEIEPGNHVRIENEKYQQILESEYWNKSIAESENLEAVFDDFPPHPAIEFRSKPQPLIELLNRDYWAKIKKEISRFPVNSLLNANTQKIGDSAFEDQLSASKWGLKGFLAAPELRHSISGKLGRIRSQQPQHATISIPLYSFFRLNPSARAKLIPWCQECSNLKTFLVTWIKHINPSKGESIEISTKKRNQLSPNIKTPIDVFLKFLNPTSPKLQQLIEEIQKNFPTRVHNPNATLITNRMVTVPATTIASYHGNPPPKGTPLRALNPYDGKAYISSEEKPRMPLYDPILNDLRILVEDRGTGLVHAAVKDAYNGKVENLHKLDAIIQSLDSPSGKQENNPLIPDWMRETCRNGTETPASTE